MGGDTDEIDETVGELVRPILLNPLISEDAALRAEYKRRHTSSVAKEVPASDVEDMEKLGWATSKSKKRSVIMVRAKTHD